MISTDYVVTMARYNAWQNRQLVDVVDAMAEAGEAAALTAGRGAFFGSILGTLNHLLWADHMWMSRLDGWRRPATGLAESPRLHPTPAAWKADRQRSDGRIVLWAERLRPAALRGDLTWISGATGAEMTRPVALCVMHLFNHQTHHRGQVHALLTAAGHDPGTTDLALAPADALA